MKPNYYIVSFSGGKDSTAMLLHLIELNQQIDEVVFLDTGLEFPDMYVHIERIKKVLEDKEIPFNILRNENGFNYYFQQYSWPSMKVRYCTSYLKTDIIRKHITKLKKDYTVFQYIGIAADETKRLERKNNKTNDKLFPLVDWNWTEEDCLNYCYSLGYDWNGLYTRNKRVSCWCCPLQSLDQLRCLRKYYPELWEQLKNMDNNTRLQFRADYSVEELDKRFNFEEEKLAKGESIKNRQFYIELKEVIKCHR